MVYKGVDRITPRVGTGITKDWIEGTSVSGMQRWMKAQTGRRYFFCSLPLWPWKYLISRALSFHLHVSTLRLSVQVQRHVFSCVLRRYLQTFCSTKIHFFCKLGILPKNFFTNWTFCRNIDEQYCGKCVEQNEILVRSSWRIKMEINRLGVAEGLRDSCSSSEWHVITLLHM